MLHDQENREKGTTQCERLPLELQSKPPFQILNTYFLVKTEEVIFISTTISNVRIMRSILKKCSFILEDLLSSRAFDHGKPKLQGSIPIQATHLRPTGDNTSNKGDELAAASNLIP